MEKLYAYKNKSKYILENSSSGGAFTAISSLVLQKGGIIFGAAFDDNWNVHHIAVDKIEELSLLQGSKYVQSTIGETYKQTELYLKEGRSVLYSGTPCQIKGLKSYLGKDYKNLLTVDFICHGVPSPGIWAAYLREKFGNNACLSDIKFRDKKYGWENYCFSLKQYIPTKKEFVKFIESKNKNSYLKGFLSDIYLRPSCYSCPVKKGTSSSDIQMGDFWGIKEICGSFYSNKGVSMLIAQTEKGNDFIIKLEGFLLPIFNEDITLINQSYGKNAVPHPKRNLFFHKYGQEPLISLINKTAKKSFRQKLYLAGRICLQNIGINHKINKMIQKWRKKSL